MAKGVIKMCLQVIAELCGNVLTIMFFSFIGFVVLVYLIGIIISLFMGLILWFALLLMNPLLYVFIISLVLGGLLFLTK